MTQSVTSTLDADGIRTLVLDLPGEKLNVLNAELTAAFEEALRAAMADPATTGILISSGKDCFVAGGDLKLMTQTDITGMSTAEVANLFASLSRLLRWLETAGKPVACAVGGIALGGGLEIALASHYRVVADDPAIQLGLPEAQVGLLAAGGGTQRLPRLIGLRAALPLLAQGKSVGPAEALKLGMVHAVVPRAELLDAAKAWLRSQPEAVQPWDKKGFKVPGGGSSLDPDFRNMFLVSNAMTRANTFGNYPAQEQLLIALYEGLQLPMDKALGIEARCFAKLMIDPVAGNLIRTMFISKGKADSLAARPAAVPDSAIRKVGIVGAGTMGAGIAFACAKSKLEVVLIDRDQASADSGKAYAASKLERDIAKGRSTRDKANVVLARIQPETAYAALGDCQIVIESVFEDREVKKAVIGQIAAAVGDSVTIASNTSALPITGLAEYATKPERFIGMHFFSPAERMPLVEIIKGEKSGDAAWAAALDLTKALRKTPITVNDGPGFFTTRFIASFVQVSLDMVEIGVNPALIENGARMLGMPMGALAISDSIGLDLSYHAGLTQAKEGGVEPHHGIIERLVVDHQRHGMKVGAGFFDYDAKGGKKLWPGLAALLPALAKQPEIEEVKDRILYAQLAEALRAFAEGVLIDVIDGDLGATLGVGFPPYLGGPFSAIDTLGLARVVKRCDELAAAYGKLYVLPESVREMAVDGRTFYGADPIPSPGLVKGD